MVRMYFARQKSALKRVGGTYTHRIIKVLRMMNAAITVRNESQSERLIMMFGENVDLKGIDIDNSVLIWPLLLMKYP